MGKTVSSERLEKLNYYPYLNVTQAATLFQKSRTTIYNAIYSGELEFIPQKRGYFIKRRALDEWVERGAPT